MSVSEGFDSELEGSDGSVLGGLVSEFEGSEETVSEFDGSEKFGSELYEVFAEVSLGNVEPLGF